VVGPKEKGESSRALLGRKGKRQTNKKKVKKKSGSGAVKTVPVPGPPGCLGVRRKQQRTAAHGNCVSSAQGKKRVVLPFSGGKNTGKSKAELKKEARREDPVRRGGSSPCVSRKGEKKTPECGIFPHEKKK